jgi:hypothetical protein
MARLLGAARFLLPLQIRRCLTALVLAFGCGGAHAIPIGDADIVHVDGREWAQPDIFRGLAWLTIHNVCPSGMCVSGTLRGYDMAGWTWARIDDMTQLFNSYIGSDFLGPGSGNYFGAADDFTVSSAFWADGWRRTATQVNLFALWDLTLGWTADHDRNGPSIGAVVDCSPSSIPCQTGDRASAEAGLAGGFFRAYTGAWFYRAAAPSAVPLPSSLWLLAAALFGWAGLRSYNARSL